MSIGRAPLYVGTALLCSGFALSYFGAFAVRMSGAMWAFLPVLLTSIGLSVLGAALMWAWSGWGE